MNFIGQTLKENDKWSMSRIIVALTFLVNVIYSGWCVWKNAVFVDLPTNWLALMTGMYLINRGAAVVDAKTAAIAASPSIATSTTIVTPDTTTTVKPA
jgi:hypothetical protein